MPTLAEFLQNMTWGKSQQPTERTAETPNPAYSMPPPTPRNYLDALVMSQAPIVSDIASGVAAVDDYRQGNKLGALLNGMGVLPFVPGVAGMIKTKMGRIPQTGSETEALAAMLQRAGERAGYDVSRSDSAISPSRYVTFSNADGDIARQVRISNHADKYPELASGVRTSVDPSTEVTFEQAVNWLAREGFPTRLSAKYKDVPTWEQHYARQGLQETEPPSEALLRLKALREEWFRNPKGPLPQLDDLK